MSAPSTESAPVRIPGRAVDMEFLAVESRIINEVLLREDGEEAPAVSPVPRRRKPQRPALDTPAKEATGSNEFMLVLYPGSEQTAEEKAGETTFLMHTQQRGPIWLYKGQSRALTETLVPLSYVSLK